MPKSPNIVLPPPVLALDPTSNKYEMVIHVTWGDFEKYVHVSKETYVFNDDLIKALNLALVEGAETNPFITHDRA